MDLPDNLDSLGRSPTFDQKTAPEALLSRHALAEKNWAELNVLAGSVTFVNLEDNASTVLETGSRHTVPPVLPHRIELDDQACFQLEFFREMD